MVLRGKLLKIPIQKKVRAARDVLNHERIADRVWVCC